MKACNDSWRVDETYIKVKKVWVYLYRAVDSEGNTLEFLLSPTRDAQATKRFVRQSAALHGRFSSSSFSHPGAGDPAHGCSCLKYHPIGSSAVESTRRWWQQSCKALYPGKRELLITTDGEVRMGSEIVMEEETARLRQ